MKRLKLLQPLTLFGIAFTLRLILISKGPYHVDCLNLALKAQETLDTGRLQFLFGSGYPLTVLLTAGMLFLTRLASILDPVFAANFMSVVFSSLCIPLLYRFTQKTLDSAAALLSAVLLCFSPVFVGVSVYGKSHAPAIFFLLLSLNFLISPDNTKKNKNLLLSAAALGCMGASRLQDMILLAVPVSILLIGTITPNVLKEKKGRPFVFFWLSVLSVTALFHLPYFLNGSSPFYQRQLQSFWHLGVANNFQGLFSIYLLRGILVLGKNFTLIGLVFAFAGFAYLLKRNLTLFLFLLTWLCIPLLFYSNIETSVARLYTVVLPPVTVALSYGAVRLSGINRFIRITALACIFIIILLPFNTYLPGIVFRHKHELLPDYARWAASRMEPDAVIIVSDDSLFFKHYGKCKILARPLKDGPLITKAELEEFKNRLDAALEKNIPVYVTALGLQAYDHKKIFSRFMLNNYDIRFVGKYPYEAWHRGVFKQIIFQNPLSRITSGK